MRGSISLQLVPTKETTMRKRQSGACTASGKKTTEHVEPLKVGVSEQQTFALLPKRARPLPQRAAQRGGFLAKTRKFHTAADETDRLGNAKTLAETAAAAVREFCDYFI